MHGSGGRPPASASAPPLAFTSGLPETVCDVLETERVLKPRHPGLSAGSARPCFPSPLFSLGFACVKSPEQGCSPRRPSLPARRSGGRFCVPCATRDLPGWQGRARQAVALASPGRWHSPQQPRSPAAQGGFPGAPLPLPSAGSDAHARPGSPRGHAGARLAASAGSPVLARGRAARGGSGSTALPGGHGEVEDSLGNGAGRGVTAPIRPARPAGARGQQVPEGSSPRSSGVLSGAPPIPAAPWAPGTAPRTQALLWQWTRGSGHRHRGAESRGRGQPHNQVALASAPAACAPPEQRCRLSWLASFPCASDFQLLKSHPQRLSRSPVPSPFGVQCSEAAAGARAPIWTG